MDAFLGLSLAGWGAVASVLALANYAPLFWGIYKGTTKPHLFSYVVWTLVAVVAAAAQWVEGAGPGMWTTWAGAFLCLLVCGLAVPYGHREITRWDWFFLLLGIAAIPLWVMTENALYAACMAAFADGVGYVPTWRKSWGRPHEENARQYVIANIKWMAAWAATAEVNVATMVFPATAFVCNTLTVAIVVGRRWWLGHRLVT